MVLSGHTIYEKRSRVEDAGTRSHRGAQHTALGFCQYIRSIKRAPEPRVLVPDRTEEHNTHCLGFCHLDDAGSRLHRGAQHVALGLCQHVRSMKKVPESRMLVPNRIEDHNTSPCGSPARAAVPELQLPLFI